MGEAKRRAAYRNAALAPSEPVLYNFNAGTNSAGKPAVTDTGPWTGPGGINERVEDHKAAKRSEAAKKAAATRKRNREAEIIAKEYRTLG